MKKSNHSTIMVISEQHGTETLSVNSWLLRNMKPTIIALSLLAGALTVGLGALALQTHAASVENQALQNKVKDLESYTSAEAAAKINELKKTEKSVLELQEYLDQRGGNKPPPKSKEDAQAVGGAIRPIAGEIPFTGRYNQNVVSLIEQIRNTPIGVPHDGLLSSKYGNRANPFSGRGAENHPGLDFKAEYGDPIHATADGEVVFSGVMGGYGNVIRIAHKSGYETLFAHMSEIDATLGQKIKAGDVVGKVGSTGRSTGPHLHYEVRLNNEQLDPENFLTMNRKN